MPAPSLPGLALDGGAGGLQASSSASSDLRTVLTDSSRTSFDFSKGMGTSEILLIGGLALVALFVFKKVK